ncbi:MAG: glycosyltransferase [Maricaulaceae bacterium]
MSKTALHKRPRKISVIIPTYKDDGPLTLLLEQLSGLDIFEIIVVDGEGRWAPPKRFADYDNLQWKTAARGRGPQIAHGLACANGNYLWVLHADAQVMPENLVEIDRILSNSKISLGMFRLSFNQPQWTYHLFEFFARFDTSLTSFGDQGFFFRQVDMDDIWKELYMDMKNAPILEDVILRHALKSIGSVKKSPLKIGSLPRRFERRGLWRTQIRNASILLRWVFGVSPHVLYDSYYSEPQSLSIRPAPPPAVVNG